MRPNEEGKGAEGARSEQGAENGSAWRSFRAVSCSSYTPAGHLPEARAHSSAPFPGFVTDKTMAVPADEAGGQSAG